MRDPDEFTTPKCEECRAKLDEDEGNACPTCYTKLVNERDELAAEVERLRAGIVNFRNELIYEDDRAALDALLAPKEAK